jgi:O-antigen/teichoic acid export membrane protein
LWLVLLLGLMQWVISLDNSARAVFAGQQRMEVLGGMEIAKVVIEAILSVSILLLGWGVIALAGVRVTVALLGLAMAMTFLARRLQVHLRWSRLAPTTALLPAGCRFAATSALSSIYERIGVVLLAQLVGAPGVALVSTALTLTEKIFWFVPAVQGAIFPFFSNLHVAAQDRLGSAFARALRYQTIIAVGCGLGLSLLGPWVIRLIFPTEFWPAGNLVAVLGWVCVPKLLGSFFLTVLQSVGRERQVSWLAGIQCAIYTCAVFTCVSRWGIPGFAWAALATEITGVMVQIILLTRLGIFVEISYGALLLIIGSGLMILFITLWLPGGRDNLVNLLGLLACYPVLVVVSRSLSGEDVRYLHGLWMNKEASAA